MESPKGDMCDTATDWMHEQMKIKLSSTEPDSKEVYKNVHHQSFHFLKMINVIYYVIFLINILRPFNL